MIASDSLESAYSQGYHNGRENGYEKLKSELLQAGASIGEDLPNGDVIIRISKKRLHELGNEE